MIRLLDPSASNSVSTLCNTQEFLGDLISNIHLPKDEKLSITLGMPDNLPRIKYTAKDLPELHFDYPEYSLNASGQNGSISMTYLTDKKLKILPLNKEISHPFASIWKLHVVGPKSSALFPVKLWPFPTLRTLVIEGDEEILSGTWIFQTFQTFTFTRLTFISFHDL